MCTTLVRGNLIFLENCNNVSCIGQLVYGRRNGCIGTDCMLYECLVLWFSV